MPRIVQLTDLHLTARIGGTARGQDVWANLHAALADARAQREPIDLLVLTGDIANQRRPATYAQLRAVLEPWHDRVRVLPGNHDSRSLLRASLGAGWIRERRSANFSLQLGGWRVLGLDSVRRPFVHGKLGREQLAWLRSELEAGTGPVLLLLHHPPIRVGSWWLDKDLLRDHLALAAAIAGGRVRAIASGHVHQDCHGTFAGAQVLTAPSTAYQFVPRTLCPALITAGIGYRVLDLLEEGRLTTQVVRLVPQRGQATGGREPFNARCDS